MTSDSSSLRVMDLKGELRADLRFLDVKEANRVSNESSQRRETLTSHNAQAHANRSRRA